MSCARSLVPVVRLHRSRSHTQFLYILCAETRVAGLYEWNQLGRKVSKGQNGICILAPMIGTRRKKDTESTSKEPAAVNTPYDVGVLSDRGVLPGLIRNTLVSLLAVKKRKILKSALPSPSLLRQHKGLMDDLKKRKQSFLLRLPISIREKAAQVAHQDGTSLNHFVSLAVAEKLSRMDQAEQTSHHQTSSQSRMDVASRISMRLPRAS